jgi:hypothetical protein
VIHNTSFINGQKDERSHNPTAKEIVTMSIYIIIVLDLYFCYNIIEFLQLPESFSSDFTIKLAHIEVCKSDPIRSNFGTKIFISDWIGLIKLFRSRIEIYFIKGFFGSEFFIKTRIRFGLDNFGSDWILNISQLSDYKRLIRSDAHLYYSTLYYGELILLFEGNFIFSPEPFMPQLLFNFINLKHSIYNEVNLLQLLMMN